MTGQLTSLTQLAVSGFIFDEHLTLSNRLQLIQNSCPCSFSYYPCS